MSLKDIKTVVIPITEYDLEELKDVVYNDFKIDWVFDDNRWDKTRIVFVNEEQYSDEAQSYE